MRFSRRSGQALVEFALVLPLLLSLFTGIIDVGFLYNRQLILTNAAREGARLGSLGRTTTQVQTAIRAYLQKAAYSPAVPSDGITVSMADGTSSVSLRSPIPLLFGFSGPTVTLSAAAQMRRE